MPLNCIQENIIDQNTMLLATSIEHFSLCKGQLFRNLSKALQGLYKNIKEFPLFVYLGPVAASPGPSPPVHPLREPGNVKKSYNLTINLAQL